jgi:carboxypeptidase family protein
MIPILVTAALFLAQQAPPPAPRTTANVEGTVVNTANAEPVAKAFVILRSVDEVQGISYAEQAEGNGHFHIDSVLPGSYFISASRQGFITPPDGAPGARPPRFTVEAAADLTGVTVRLTPLGVITGRVLDADGDPVRNATVSAMQSAYISGRRQLRNVMQVQTNSKGEYRMFDLKPGKYYVQASSAGGQNASAFVQSVRGPRPPNSYVPTFYPNSIDATSAVAVDLRAGAQLSGFDITLRAVVFHTVRVKIPDNTRASISPWIVLRNSEEGGTQSWRMARDAIEFLSVLPGSYVVMATRTEGATRSYARQELEVGDADVDGGTLTFSPGEDISGTLKIDKASLLPKNFHVMLQPDGFSLAGPAQTVIQPDGTFVFSDVAPGNYRLAFDANTLFYLKSIRIGDQELPDRRLDLTHGDAQLTLALATDVGQIDGTSSPHVRVTMFPEGDHAARDDLFKFVFTDEKGNFSFNGVAPGDYRLFAWQDVEQDAPQDPEFRKRFEKQSVVVKLPPNGNQTVQLPPIVAEVAHALLRAAFALMRTQGFPTAPPPEAHSSPYKAAHPADTSAQPPAD